MGFMASKATYSVIAVVGIAAASGAAWWYQQPKNAQPAEAPRSEASPAAGSRAVAGSGAPSAAGGAPGGGMPPAVEVAKVEVAKLLDETQAVGTLRSRRGVVLRPEVPGRITQLNFTDGQRVKAGQMLVQFDDQLQQAQVQQSLAEVSIAQANQKRNQELVAQNFVSQRSLDESAANLQVAQARLTLARATAARLKIIAPFDGVAGIRSVNVGDYLRDGADIVNIEDMDAVFVDFRLPERFLSKLKRGQIAQVELDAVPGRKFSAQIQAIDPLIDANGRSVGVRGCIDNRVAQLRPGMFARVNPIFGMKDNARVVPEEAIVPQGGKLTVIKLIPSSDGKTQSTQRLEVKVGQRSPGRVEILDGLEAGDTVVTAGHQRVQKDGTVVNVVDTSSPRGGRPGADVAAGSPARSADNSAGAANSAANPAASESPRLANAVPALLSVAPSGQAAIARGAQDVRSAGKEISVSRAETVKAAPGPSPCGLIEPGAATGARKPVKPLAE